MTSPITPTDLSFLQTLAVLYVEDEEEVRQAMARFLSRRFAKVDVATNGQEGIELFGKDHYDVVITDIKMPVMDGLTMAGLIKDLSCEVPVIVVTAYNESDFLLRAIDIGIDHYVKKPVDPYDLIQAVQKSMQSHRHQQEMEKANLRLLSTLESVIGALARAIEIRDPYTDGHQKRVSRIADKIAHEMGLPEHQINGIRLGGMIHDIGKISVPVDLLMKPRKLTELEFEFLKMHPRAGADILTEVEFPWPISEMILQHHERIDGSGYPQGLAGEQITLEARIIAVADVLDAMISDRPYRVGCPIDKPIAEFQAHKGTRYDPQVVEACLRLIERGEMSKETFA